MTSLHDVESILGGVSSDVIVLDLPLFGHDSLEEISRLSKIGSHYLIVFGDDANGIDGISALEAGADYFLYRDYEPREILAVIRAIRRRSGRRKRAGGVQQYRFDGFVFDVETNLLVGPSGRRVLLTLTELALLKMFLVSKDKPLSRESLAAALPPYQCDRVLRAVDTHVSRLRRKLGYHSTSSLILTIRQRGYLFGAEVAEIGHVDQAA